MPKVLIDLEKAGFSALYIKCEECNGSGTLYNYSTKVEYDCPYCTEGQKDNRDTVILELATAISALEASLKGAGIPLRELKGVAP